MKHITYTTEKRINEIKEIEYKTLQQEVAVHIWTCLLNEYCLYNFRSLKAWEKFYGKKELIGNAFELEITDSFKDRGIFGLEYATGGNVRYIGTNDLSFVIVKDFNKFVLTCLGGN